MIRLGGEGRVYLASTYMFESGASIVAPYYIKIAIQDKEVDR